MENKSITLDLNMVEMAEIINEGSDYLVDTLILEGQAAYERHVQRRENQYVYPLAQLVAMNSTRAVKEGFNNKMVKQARLILCSYLLGLPASIESFNDLQDFQLNFLYGIFRSEEYAEIYDQDLIEVYTQLCQIP